jgi:hypothetical protein
MKVEDKKNELIDAIRKAMANGDDAKIEKLEEELYSVEAEIEKGKH